MRTNKRKSFTALRTHEGAPGKRITPLLQLHRSVLSTMLFEDQFYEDGKTIADRILELARQNAPRDVAALAIDARENGNLRHVPLLLAYSLTETASGWTLPSDTITRIIQRADELTEFVALYMKYSGQGTLSNQAKIGLANAFHKFDEYQLAKYDRKDAEWRLRDVMFLVHPKPKDKKQKKLFKRLANDALKTPDTWETKLSKAGQTATTTHEKQQSKKDVFEGQLRTGKLGYMALLRNLRGMSEVGVDKDLIKTAVLSRRGAQRVLPFRFVAAAKAAPQFERELDQALIHNIKTAPQLSGKTVVLVDVSYSMTAQLSNKSDMTRMIAAATLASVINAEDLRVFSFSHRIVEVPPRQGMAGVDAIIRSQMHQGTYLGAAVTYLNQEVDHDRLIVITDEQSHDRVPDPVAQRAYMINVASHRNGVGYGRWTHIDGFSEQVIRFITELETLDTERT